MPSDLRGNLEPAMTLAEQRLERAAVNTTSTATFQQLLSIAESNPSRENRMLFSNHLMRVNDAGVISRRQAEGSLQSLLQREVRFPAG